MVHLCQILSELVPTSFPETLLFHGDNCQSQKIPTVQLSDFLLVQKEFEAVSSIVISLSLLRL